jgi:hypothetical protein
MRKAAKTLVHEVVGKTTTITRSVTTLSLHLVFVGGAQPSSTPGLKLQSFSTSWQPGSLWSG